MNYQTIWWGWFFCHLNRIFFTPLQWNIVVGVANFTRKLANTVVIFRAPQQLFVTHPLGIAFTSLHVAFKISRSRSIGKGMPKPDHLAMYRLSSIVQKNRNVHLNSQSIMTLWDRRLPITFQSQLHFVHANKTADRNMVTLNHGTSEFYQQQKISLDVQYIKINYSRLSSPLSLFIL